MRLNFWQKVCVQCELELGCTHINLFDNITVYIDFYGWWIAGDPKVGFAWNLSHRHLCILWRYGAPRRHSFDFITSDVVDFGRCVTVLSWKLRLVVTETHVVLFPKYRYCFWLRRSTQRTGAWRLVCFSIDFRCRVTVKCMRRQTAPRFSWRTTANYSCLVATTTTVVMMHNGRRCSTTPKNSKPNADLDVVAMVYNDKSSIDVGRCREFVPMAPGHFICSLQCSA